MGTVISLSGDGKSPLHVIVWKVGQNNAANDSHAQAHLLYIQINVICLEIWSFGECVLRKHR